MYSVTFKCDELPNDMKMLAIAEGMNYPIVQDFSQLLKMFQKTTALT